MKRQHVTVSIYREDDNEIQVTGWVYPAEPEVRYGPNSHPGSPEEVEIESAYDEIGNEIALTHEEEERVKQEMLETPHHE